MIDGGGEGKLITKAFQFYDFFVLGEGKVVKKATKLRGMDLVKYLGIKLDACLHSKWFKISKFTQEIEIFFLNFGY